MGCLAWERTSRIIMNEQRRECVRQYGNVLELESVIILDYGCARVMITSLSIILESF